MINVKYVFDLGCFATLTASARELNRLIPGNVPHQKISKIFVKTELALITSIALKALHDYGTQHPTWKRTCHRISYALLAAVAYLEWDAPVPVELHPTLETTPYRIALLVLWHGVIHFLPN